MRAVRRAVADLARPVLLTTMVTLAMVAFGRSFGSAAPTPNPPLIVPSTTPSGQTASVGSQGQLGRLIYLRDCAWCHGNQAEGGDRGPALIGVGAESADFMLTTGRMPIPQVERQPPHRSPRYPPEQIDALVAYISSLGSGPAIPAVDPSAGNLGQGEDLYEENCAACHSSTGIGAALTTGLEAPSLLRSTPVQVVEAMRLGGAGLRTGKMPKFGPDVIDDQQANSIARYVQYLQHPEDRGGQPLGRVGPVVDGFVTWVLALAVLVLLIRWIGTRSRGNAT